MSIDDLAGYRLPGFFFDFLRSFQGGKYTIIRNLISTEDWIGRCKMSDPSKQSADEALVQQAGQGRLESFGALYRRYYGSMVALAYSMTGDIYAAEDAAQETFAMPVGTCQN